MLGLNSPSDPAVVSPLFVDAGHAPPLDSLLHTASKPPSPDDLQGKSDRLTCSIGRKSWELDRPGAEVGTWNP